MRKIGIILWRIFTALFYYTGVLILSGLSQVIPKKENTRRAIDPPYDGRRWLPLLAGFLFWVIIANVFNPMPTTRPAVHPVVQTTQNAVPAPAAASPSMQKDAAAKARAEKDEPNAPEAPTPKGEAEAKDGRPFQNQGPVDASQGNYIASSKSHIFHTLDCRSAQKIKEENRVYFATREDAVNAHYKPAKDCNP